MIGRKWTSPIDDGTYNSWRAMHRRCSGRDVHSDYYGGIGVCEEWKNFDAFYRDMGRRPKGMTIERNDVEKGYNADNCRWATRAEQSLNTRRTIRLTHDGKTMALPEWAAFLDVPYYLLWNRVKLGWSTADILNPNRKVLPAKHGSLAMYAKGCRCDLCKAHRAAHYREKKHGSTA